MTNRSAKIGTAWSKLRWSLVHRGIRETLFVAARRALQPGRGSSHARPLHPFDRRYDVETGGLIGGGELHSGHPHDRFNTAYYGMAPSRFEWIMRQWTEHRIASGAGREGPPAIGEYSFVDLGCGKGRAVLMATGLPFRQVIGVELHLGLARVAEQNLAVWERAGRSLCPARILCQDAAEFIFPPGPCLLYLFNPFAAQVVRKVIERIQAQFEARQGQLDIIYFNPESGDLFAVHSGFQLLWSGTVPMSEEDTAADYVASPEDPCSVFRWIGMAGGTA